MITPVPSGDTRHGFYMGWRQVSDQRHNLSVFYDTSVPDQGCYQAVGHA
jgi:hypothetical protein